MVRKSGQLNSDGESEDSLEYGQEDHEQENVLDADMMIDLWKKL